MNMIRATLLAMVGAMVATAQVCPARAQLTLAGAKAAAARGDRPGAERLIEQARRECPTSAETMRGIAGIYRDSLNNAAMADLFDKAAAEMGESVRTQIGATVLREPVPNEDKSFVREKWALVVGIGKFQQSNIPELRFAAKDARDFAATLRDPEAGRFVDDADHVLLLTDAQATVSAIRSAINTIARKARAEDLVVLYFSSHGSSADMDIAAARGQTGYIIAHDTRVDDLYASALPMDELRRVADDRLQAGRVVMFLDTCYSGDAGKRAANSTVPGGGKALQIAIPQDSYARIAQAKGRVVITSSRATERSWESDAFQNSYFTYFLMQKLRESRGLATVTDLYTHLQRSVPSAVSREKSATQTPWLFPEGRRVDIVIGAAVQ
jgi:hypothetical protein